MGYNGVGIRTPLQRILNNYVRIFDLMNPPNISEKAVSFYVQQLHGYGALKKLVLFLVHLRPTQPPTLSETENEYWPKCGVALWLSSKGRYGSFHLWINVWVAGKTV